MISEKTLFQREWLMKPKYEKAILIDYEKRDDNSKVKAKKNERKKKGLRNSGDHVRRREP
jgi:RecA-family ATPase